MAIEQELEVLHNAYYEELEQRPNLSEPINSPPSEALNTPASGDDLFSFGKNFMAEGQTLAHNIRRLTTINPVDCIIRVADDLLKSNGAKFIEMMEQLAERRVAREDKVYSE